MSKKHRDKARRKAWKRLLRELKEIRLSNFLLLTVAGVVNAFGVTIFLFPVKLYDSGISGLSMLLDQVTPPHFTLSLFLILLNVPIFLFGLKKQGVLFTFYSVYAITVYSVMSFLIMNVLPIDVEFVSPLAGFPPPSPKTSRPAAPSSTASAAIPARTGTSSTSSSITCRSTS